MYLYIYLCIFRDTDCQIIKVLKYSFFLDFFLELVMYLYIYPCIFRDTDWLIIEVLKYSFFLEFDSKGIGS